MTERWVHHGAAVSTRRSSPVGRLSNGGSPGCRPGPKGMGVRIPPGPPHISRNWTRAHIAQLAEHFLGKEEVIGSSPIVGSTRPPPPVAAKPRLSIGVKRSRGQEEVRAHQAARQRRDDRPHRPRQDQPDRGDHEVPRPEGRGGVPRLRHDRQRARGARARASRSRSPTSSTRPTPATTPTSTARATPTTSRT